MNAGRELILLAFILLILLINLSGSDNSLPFFSEDPLSSTEGPFVEVLTNGKAALVSLKEARGKFILSKGEPLKEGDSLHVTEKGVKRGRMKGGTLLLLGLPVNVNEATTEDLVAISGIGPKRAESIVAYREKNGPFSSLSDLVKVKGIGEKSFTRMKNFLTL